MKTLTLLKVLEQLQHENFDYTIDYMDRGDHWEYQIVVPYITKKRAKYLRAVLNEDYELGVDVEFIPEFNNKKYGQVVMDTGIKEKVDMYFIYPLIAEVKRQQKY